MLPAAAASGFIGTVHDALCRASAIRHTSRRCSSPNTEKKRKTSPHAQRHAGPSGKTCETRLVDGGGLVGRWHCCAGTRGRGDPAGRSAAKRMHSHPQRRSQRRPAARSRRATGGHGRRAGRLQLSPGARRPAQPCGPVHSRPGRLGAGGAERPDAAGQQRDPHAAAFPTGRR